MLKARRRKPKKATKGNNKVGLSLKKVFSLFFIFLFLVYIIYSLVIFLGIRARDPLSENISRHKFLSNSEGDLEKTIFIIEREIGEESVVSDVYVFLNNARIAVFGILMLFKKVARVKFAM